MFLHNKGDNYAKRKNRMETILITGGTGLVGRHLCRELTRAGYQVIILTRRIPEGRSQPGVSYATWNVKAGTIDTDALSRADHIIHLAGAGVMDKKWTKAYKEEIISSRAGSAALIIEQLRKTAHHVTSFISSSAIGYYGADQPGGSPFEETAPADTHFLGEVCRLWEESVEPVKTLGIRLVKLRTGIVLATDGGALPEFISPLRFGVATVLGNGRQVMSWIHIDDLCRLFRYAIENNKMNGVYNAVAPCPVTNRELVTQTAFLRNNKRYLRLPVPDFALKLFLGGRSIEVLKSATVSSKKTEAAGFRFEYPTVDEALTDLIRH